MTNIEQLRNLQTWIISHASGAAAAPDFETLRGWACALASVTGDDAPEGWRTALVFGGGFPGFKPKVEPSQREDTYVPASAHIGMEVTPPQSLFAANITTMTLVDPKWNAIVLQRDERRSGRDPERAFMDYFMGGAPMVREGQEVKLFVTEVEREGGRVTVALDYRPVPAEG